MFSLTPPDYSLADRDWSWLVERLRREGAREILDVGCGRGHWSVALARAGFRVTAIDISSVAIARLEAWATEEGLPLRACVCPAQEIPWNWAFDAVIANSVLDHMFKAEAEEAMRRIRAVLRPGGLLLLGMDGPPDAEDVAWPHEVFPDGTWQFLGGRRDRMLWRFWPEEEIAELLLGFRVESGRCCPTAPDGSGPGRVRRAWETSRNTSAGCGTPGTHWSRPSVIRPRRTTPGHVSRPNRRGQLALKALLRGLGRPAFGHSLGRLMEELKQTGLGIPPEVVEAARALERHYIPSRYPDVFPSGTPADFYTPEDSERAIQHAERILAFVAEVGGRELGAGP